MSLHCKRKVELQDFADYFALGDVRDAGLSDSREGEPPSKPNVFVCFFLVP